MQRRRILFFVEFAIYISTRPPKYPKTRVVKKFFEKNDSILPVGNVIENQYDE